MTEKIEGVLDVVHEKKGCPEFLSFLNDTIGSDEEVRRVQEFMGYCLMNRARFPNYMVLFGNSESKALFLGVLTKMVGLDRCSFEELTEDIFCMAPRVKNFDLNITKIGVNDLNRCAPVLHTIVSGDPCVAEDENGISRAFFPACKFVFSHQGGLSDISIPSGVQARILPVTFRFEPPAPLTTILPSEMFGIRSFAIEGWWRLFERGRFERPSVFFPPEPNQDSNKSFQD